MTVYSGGFVMRDATVTIDDVQYANQVSKARLVPDTAIQTQKTLVPDGVIQDVDTPTWTFEITGVQSTDMTGSLVAALNDAAGTEVDCVLTPSNGAGKATATFSIKAVSVDFGGDQGSINTFDATFPVVGQPVFSTTTSS